MTSDERPGNPMTQPGSRRRGQGSDCNGMPFL